MTDTAGFAVILAFISRHLRNFVYVIVHGRSER
jgi:hypothetical protein